MTEEKIQLESFKRSSIYSRSAQFPVPEAIVQTALFPKPKPVRLSHGPKTTFFILCCYT